MSRPLRIEFAGACYHVMARGNAREPIFIDDQDRQTFLDRVARACERFDWMLWAYCLMGNHNHLLVETRRAVRCDPGDGAPGLCTLRGRRRRRGRSRCRGERSDVSGRCRVHRACYTPRNVAVARGAPPSAGVADAGATPEGKRGP